MSISQLLEKIKPFYTLLLILVVSSIFFAIGRLSTLENAHAPIKIEYPNGTSTATVLNTLASGATEVQTKSVLPTNSGGEVIGSKSGKKYYFPWCGTVKRILPQNQVHFASIDDAKKAGFTPGGNCKGLN